MTALAVWLGAVVNRAREQRKAVEAIEEAGGTVFYDWQFDEAQPEEPPGPAWFRRFVGDDFFQEPREVAFSRSLLRQASDPIASDIRKAIPILQRLGGLRVIVISVRDKNIEGELVAALPNCEVEYHLIDF